MLTPRSGRIIFEGSDITSLDQDRMRPIRRRMQIVYPDLFGSLNPRVRVRDIVGEPLKVHGMPGEQTAFRQRSERTRRFGSRRAGWVPPLLRERGLVNKASRR